MEFDKRNNFRNAIINSMNIKSSTGIYKISESKTSPRYHHKSRVKNNVIVNSYDIANAFCEHLIIDLAEVW